VTPFTDQVTAVLNFPVPWTITTNGICPRVHASNGTEPIETEETAEGGGVGVGGAGDDPPPPHAASRDIASKSETLEPIGAPYKKRIILTLISRTS
jgi:hypothetical protein